MSEHSVRSEPPGEIVALTPFDDGWVFRRHDEVEAIPVRLPHDAMLHEGRSPVSPGGAHNGYFLGGRYIYTKTWHVGSPANCRRRSLLFEGVQGTTRVVVNGTDVGGCRSGYTEFQVPLDGVLLAGENRVEVHVDNAHQPNSRWYTGSGLYRHVWLRERGLVGFAADGLRLRTRSVADPARVELLYELDGTTGVAADVEVTVQLRNGDAVIAATTTKSFPAGTLELTVPSPRLWSANEPHLDTAEVRVLVGGELSDERVLQVGLRTIEVDPRQVLRVNGQPVLLRGACVHHDNGVLGAATFRAAEFRRARILKANGFNAIRSAHNPMSCDLLDACDEVGLYVMDELFDSWLTPKTRHDGARHFLETWEQDVRAMVAKDRNHASVVLYSIGNEIGDTVTREGVETAQRLASLVRVLDADRPVTLALNFLLNLGASYGHAVGDPGDDSRAESPPRIGSTVVNGVLNRLGARLQHLGRLPRADAFTRDAFAEVDVSGYNYTWMRYRGDARCHPQRVIVGTETFPGELARVWQLVEQLPHVIGDFVWTGWDYLGEAGLGTCSYGMRTAPTAKLYPHLTAGCGAIDITGRPGAPALLARAVWDQLPAAAIAVRPLDHAGEPVARTSWRSTDAVESWSWTGCEGLAAEIEVYAADEEVGLLVNGRSLGRQPAGRAHGCLARFTAPYEPGELVAIGYRRGVESGHSALRSASGPLRVRLRADRASLWADGQDLAFLQVELADVHGVAAMTAISQVHLRVDGPGVLAGFGSATPATEESFLSSERTTHYGRALAVVRAETSDGTVAVTATTRAHGTATLHLPVVRSPSTLQRRTA